MRVGPPAEQFGEIGGFGGFRIPQVVASRPRLQMASWSMSAGMVHMNPPVCPPESSLLSFRWGWIRLSLAAWPYVTHGCMAATLVGARGLNRAGTLLECRTDVRVRVPWPVAPVAGRLGLGLGGLGKLGGCWRQCALWR